MKSRFSRVIFGAVGKGLIRLLCSHLFYIVDLRFQLEVTVGRTESPRHWSVSFQMLLLRYIIPFEIRQQCARKLNRTQVCFGLLNSLLSLVEIVAARYPWLDQHSLDVTSRLSSCRFVQSVNFARVEMCPEKSSGYTSVAPTYQIWVELNLLCIVSSKEAFGLSSLDLRRFFGD